MKAHKQRTISGKDQIALTKLILASADVGTATKQAPLLRALSSLTLLLEPYADETEVAILFSLSEYCYESADELENGPDIDADGRSWRSEVRNELDAAVSAYSE